MKRVIKRIFILFLLVSSFFVFNSIVTNIELNADAYYSTITATSGDSLKLQLRELITDTHTYKSSYNDCKNPSIIEKTDGDPNKPGNILLFWSGLSIDSAWDGTWNREHVWPQSQGWFGTSGAGSDLHHIRPTDVSVNSSHGNDPYGIVTSGKNVKCSTANNSYVTDCLKGNSLFEPCDERKGDAARIIFYMLTRYSDSDKYPITYVATSYDLLLEWNESDPVDVLEINRNNAVASIQGNRNPYIDNPDYANMIWGDGTSSGGSTGGETGGNEGNTDPEIPDIDKPTYNNGWNLVTSESELASGDEVIIVASNYDHALSTMQNTNNRGVAIVSKSSDKSLIENISDGVQVLTLGKTVSGYYTLSTGNGYLYAADSNGSQNYLRTTIDSSDLDAQWAITIISGIAKVQAQGDAVRNIIRYNLNASNNNPIFSCYSSGQTDISIYKYDSEEIVEDPKDASDEFSELKTKTSLSFNYTYTNDSIFVSEYKYKLVNSVSELNVGDKIIIVASKDNYALSTTQNSNYRGQASITRNNDIIDAINSDVQILTLGKTDAGNYTLSTGSGYLYASGTGSQNYLGTKNDNSDLDAQWAISISDGIATIKAQGDAQRDIINYNKGSTRFSCYATTSGQQSVCIYKETEVKVDQGTVEYNINSIGIRFGNMISAELYNELLLLGDNVKFGVVALKSSTLDTDGKNLEDYVGTKNYYECAPVRVNEFGEEDVNGDYYQFALVIKGIPMSDIDNDIAAACYVSIDGEITLMKQSVQSVRSVTETYLVEGNINDEYKGVLTYIYNY